MTDHSVVKFSFSASARIRHSSEFQQLRRHGRRFETTHFLIFYLLRSTETQRLGLTVSRKVGNAVVRNQVKRRVREFFRTRRPCLHAGLELSVVARPGAGLLNQGRVEEELSSALGRLALMDRS